MVNDKFCVDCRWHTLQPQHQEVGGEGAHICVRPEKVSLVTGQPSGWIRTPCKKEREVVFGTLVSCGPDGDFWEPRTTGRDFDSR